jgi:NAD(P)-dependent dehydrogenase (short-subunit alcohol dehydrogenase family)
MTKLLEGKTAIITGASYGIGKSIAALFSEHGANVVLTARGKKNLDDAVEEIKKAGGKAIGVVANSSSVEACKEVFAKTISEFGQIDILVNNAAKGEIVAIEAVTDELLDEVVDTNFKGPIIYCREAVQYMLPRKSGVIINVSSVNGVRPMCGAVYSSTKGGLNTLTQNIAIRLVGTGVRINALCPGFTVTPASSAQERGETAPSDGSMIEILHSRTVRTVQSQAIEQAQIALFLASDLSSAVQGQILVADKGSFL